MLSYLPLQNFHIDQKTNMEEDFIKNKLNSMNVGGAIPSRTTTLSSSSTTSMEKDKEGEWEKRPGGMLVQKRDDNLTANPTKIIRVRVVHGAARFEIPISSQASFGELKKQLAEQCGLQHWEQRITYKGKEREDKQFLDFCGVKDRSKLILTEDPCSREKRYLEMRKNNKIQRAHQAISEVASQVDCLEEQVSSIEKSIEKGVRVAEVGITTLIELLMREAVKLDSISTDGELSVLKNLQGKRVQKSVETLDKLKVSNASIKPVAVASKWETSDPPSNTTQYWNLLD